MPHQASNGYLKYRLAHQISFWFVLSMLITTLAPNAAMADQTLVKANPENTEQVKHGELVYRRFCSLCHGRNLEGQPNWRIRKPDGKLPAPPHDETGHTWHHPDEVLFAIIKFGLLPPNAPQGYLSDMPAWGETLKDEDIWAVLAYIKSRWPAKEREIQAKITRDAQQ